MHRPWRDEPGSLSVKQRALQILWPAFMAAGVLEMLVFAVIDPADMHWFSGPAVLWSTQAIYTVTFLIFWVVVSTASAMTALLSIETDDFPEAGEGSPPQPPGSGTPGIGLGVRDERVSHIS